VLQTEIADTWLILPEGEFLYCQKDVKAYLQHLKVDTLDSRSLEAMGLITPPKPMARKKTKERRSDEWCH
jgi:hypothetical protein